MLMTSPIFWWFEKFLAYTLFLRSFIVVRPQMAKLNWAFCPPPIHFRGIQDPFQNTVNSNFGVFSRLLTPLGLGFCQPKKKVQLIFIKLMLFSMELSVVSFGIKKLKTGHSLLP